MEFGSHGGILFKGALEKRRDGALRAGWAVRTFVLTRDGLYYFRRVSETDLLGEERGQMLLEDMTSIRTGGEEILQNNTVEAGNEYYYLEISTKLKTILMRVVMANATTCESWSIALYEQRNARGGISQTLLDATHETGATSPSASSFLEAYPEMPRHTVPELLSISVVSPPAYLSPRPTSPLGPSSSSRNDDDVARSSSSSNPLSSSFSSSTYPRRSLPQEHIVKTHGLSWGDTLVLGSLHPGGATIITLKNGEMVRVSTAVLMSCAAADAPRWIELTSSGMAEALALQLSVTCTKPSTVSMEPPSLLSSSSSSVTPKDRLLSMKTLKTSLRASEETLAWVFLALTVVLHVTTTGIEAFPVLEKLLVILGIALAIVSLVVKPSRYPRTRSDLPLSSAEITAFSGPGRPAANVFALTLHGCKVHLDGHECIYPIETTKDSGEEEG